MERSRGNPVPLLVARSDNILGRMARDISIAESIPKVFDFPSISGNRHDPAAMNRFRRGLLTALNNDKASIRSQRQAKRVVSCIRALVKPIAEHFIEIRFPIVVIVNEPGNS